MRVYGAIIKPVRYWVHMAFFLHAILVGASAGQHLCCLHIPLVSHPTAPGDGFKTPEGSGKLPKVLGDALAGAMEAGNWLLFSKSAGRGPCCGCQGTCEDEEQLLLHGLSPSQEKGWERQGLGAAKPLTPHCCHPGKAQCCHQGWNWMVF